MPAESFRQSPSDHLLRLLASVPPSSAILDLGCGGGCHTEAFLRLGFPVHACDPRPAAVRQTRAVVRALVDADTAQRCVQEVPLENLDGLDASFDWIVADRAEAFVTSRADLTKLFEHSRRLLTPGGWLYVSVPAPRDEADSAASGEAAVCDPLALEAEHLDVDLTEARAPTRIREEGELRVRALYRRVDSIPP